MHKLRTIGVELDLWTRLSDGAETLKEQRINDNSSLIVTYFII